MTLKLLWSLKSAYLLQNSYLLYVANLLDFIAFNCSNLTNPMVVITRLQLRTNGVRTTQLGFLAKLILWSLNNEMFNAWYWLINPWKYLILIFANVKSLICVCGSATLLRSAICNKTKWIWIYDREKRPYKSPNRYVAIKGLYKTIKRPYNTIKDHSFKTMQGHTIP